MDAAISPTNRTRVMRLPKRAVYEREQINAILDDGFLCHVGFVVDGQPYVIPTSYVRNGEFLYIHGSAASRMLRSATSDVDVCVTVTLVDGFVLARSAFHHSMNYRSVVVLGRARLVTDPQEKVTALEAFTNHMVAGRWDEARVPTAQELKGTHVLALELNEASAKVRTGGPIDEEDDYLLPVWAGVVPVAFQVKDPVPDSRLHPDATPFDKARLKRRA